MGKSKSWTLTETISAEEEKLLNGKWFCVKRKIFKDKILIKIIEKKLFKTKSEAEQYYNQCNNKGETVQLSAYESCNERNLKSKLN